MNREWDVVNGKKAPWLPEAWDAEADLVIVGYGGAGAMAAIAARHEGASCIVLEKSTECDGGNTAVSGGHVHTACGVDVEEWLEICRHGAHGATPVEILRGALNYAQDTPAWLEKYGMNFIWTDEYGDGHRRPSEYQNGFVAGRAGITGPYLWEELDACAKKYGVEVRLNHWVNRLIQNPITKEILGVKADTPDGEKYYRAEKGVILCCGGYENNVELQNNYSYPGVRFFPWGTPYNTGDAVIMGEAVGAKMWHMSSVESSSLGFMIPSQMADCSISTDATDGIKPYHYVIVDYHGNRFFKEDRTGAHAHDHHPGLNVDTHTYDYEHLPMFLIFDKNLFEAGPLWKGTGRAGIVNTYAGVWNERHPDQPLFDWGTNNERGLKEGWIFKGDTLEELAANIRAKRPCDTPAEEICGISAKNLKKTVDRWNELCRQGADTDFKRDPGHMQPIEEGPFYAVELCFSCINTQGGPAKNAECQTLNPYGEVIPHLYNCGECGSYNGFLYVYGNILEALTTGWVAARHALGVLESRDKTAAKKAADTAEREALDAEAVAKGKTCMFTGEYYESIEEAVEEANNHGGGTITLLADTPVSTNGRVPDMCFNSNFAIRSKKGGPAFRIYRGEKDRKEMLQVTEGTLRLINVVVDGACEGGAHRAAIRLSDLGKIILKGTVICNNTSDNADNMANQGASAICCVGEKTSLTLNSDCVIRNCHAVGQAVSAITAFDGTIVNNNVVFEDNTTDKGGSANYVDLTGNSHVQGASLG